MCVFTTWIKKDDGLEGGVLVVVDLNILERLHQLVQHSVGYPADLRLGAVPVDQAAVACRHQACRSVSGCVYKCVLGRVQHWCQSVEEIALHF